MLFQLLVCTALSVCTRYVAVYRNVSKEMVSEWYFKPSIHALPVGIKKGTGIHPLQSAHCLACLHEESLDPLFTSHVM